MFFFVFFLLLLFFYLSLLLSNFLFFSVSFSPFRSPFLPLFYLIFSISLSNPPFFLSLCLSLFPLSVVCLIFFLFASFYSLVSFVSRLLLPSSLFKYMSPSSISFFSPTFISSIYLSPLDCLFPYLFLSYSPSPLFPYSFVPSI